MDAVFSIAALALGIGFAFFVPVFFTAVADVNASFDYAGLRSFLPRIFKVGFWFFLIISIVGAASLPFFSEGRTEVIVETITGLTLAWRLWLAGKKQPNKAPEPTTTSVTSPAAQEPRQP